MKNIRIILVNPSHPGNIGATARAMKTMGLEDLYLVEPKIFPHANATAMAAGADDILEKAVITSSLEEALVDTQIVFGTSARLRELQLPLLGPKEAAKTINEKASKNNIAILFGRENNGLSNEELGMCNYHLHIPTNPNFSSLNIAAAVQIIAYELKMALKKNPTTELLEPELASSKEVLDFYEHLQETLLSLNFLFPNNQGNTMAKLKRLFNRAQPEKSEISILRGILTAVNKKK